MPCKPPVAYSNPRSIAELHEPLRSRVAQAIKDCPYSLWLVSGRRTDYMQWLIRHQRCPGNECNPAYKGSPQAAIPGRSNHRNISSTVAAADLGGAGLAWLAAHEEEYGLARTVPGERWHFESRGTPTRKITPYGGKPAAEKDKWIPIEGGDTDAKIEKRGGFDNQIAELQLRLKLLSKSWGDKSLDPGKFADGVPDGVYGPKTQAAVINFKKRIIALQKATKQKPWPNSDSLVGEKTIDMLRWWTA